MNEQEKREIINFYQENSLLWNSGDPDHNNKQNRATVRESLAALFNAKYSVEAQGGN